MNDQKTTPAQVAKHVESMLTNLVQELARHIAKTIPEGWGFGLVLFEFSDTEGAPLLWVSNGKREEMVEAMQEFVDRNSPDGRPKRK